MTSRYAVVLLAAVAVIGLAAVGAAPVRAQEMDTPGIASVPAGSARATLTITAGPSGAPAGFTVWWMKESDYIANGSEWFLYGDTRQGEATFWGAPTLNTNGGQYTTFALAPNQSITIEVGDLNDESGVTMTTPESDQSTGGELESSTSYVFCAYANATAQVYQSELTVTVQSQTQSTNCTFTQGYWKNHPNAWPAGCLPMTLGSNSYTQAQLLQILNEPVNGNGAISLAHQLIAAKLNVCQGAVAGTTGSCMTAADALLSGCGANKIPPIGGCSLDPGATATSTECMDDFNNGVSGPGHCGETPAKSNTWGHLKAIYR
jgi:hypothetical protein